MNISVQVSWKLPVCNTLIHFIDLWNVAVNFILKAQASKKIDGYSTRNLREGKGVLKGENSNH